MYASQNGNLWQVARVTCLDLPGSNLSSDRITTACASHQMIRMELHSSGVQPLTPLHDPGPSLPCWECALANAQYPGAIGIYD